MSKIYTVSVDFGGGVIPLTAFSTRDWAYKCRDELNIMSEGEYDLRVAEMEIDEALFDFDGGVGLRSECIDYYIEYMSIMRNMREMGGNLVSNNNKHLGV